MMDYWWRAFRKAFTNSISFFGIGSLRRLMVSAVSFTVAVIVLKWLTGETQWFGGSGQVSQELHWMIATLIAGAFFFVPTFLFHFLCAPYQMEKTNKSQADNKLTSVGTALIRAQEELASLKATLPRLKFHSWENEQAVISNATGKVYGTPFFFHALFNNDPEKSTPSAHARKVAAHIEFWTQEGERLFSMVGRWAYTPEVAQKGREVVEEPTIDLSPNAVPKRLDLVLKYREDDACYAYNNEVPLHGPSDWREPTRLLKSGSYLVIVRLRGENVDETFRLSLVNGGIGQLVELRQVISP